MVQWRFGKWVIVEKPFEFRSMVIQNKVTITDSLLVKFSSGENKFKILIESPQKISTKEVSFFNKDAGDDANVWKVDRYIVSDTKNNYKILDSKQKIVLKGIVKAGGKIDVSALKKGTYLYITDHSQKEFIKN